MGGDALVDSTVDLPVMHSVGDGAAEVDTARSFGGAPSAVLLSVTPDFQFANAQRVTDACTEALALLRPHVLILDLSGASGPTHLGGVGVALDTTGAAALHAIADTAAAAGGIVTLAYGLSAANVAHVISAARAEAGGGMGSDASELVRREGGRAAGNVLLAPSFAAARAAAAAICLVRASSRSVLHVASLNEDGGDDDGDDEKEASLLSGERGVGASASMVRAVPPSPFAAAAILVRRQQGVLPPSQRHRELLAAGDVERRSFVDGILHEISSAGRELWQYLTSDPPLLVAAIGDKI